MVEERQYTVDGSVCLNRTRSKFQGDCWVKTLNFRNKLNKPKQKFGWNNLFVMIFLVSSLEKLVRGLETKKDGIEKIW